MQTGSPSPLGRAVVLLDGIEVERTQGDRSFELRIDHLEVRAGELIAIVGASGSGKSTLLDLMALILPPRKHTSFLIGGEDVPINNGEIPGAARRRRGIGFVLQHGALLPFLNVQDNICLGAAIAGKVPDRMETDDLISRLGLNGLESALPGKISGGQRQRVALARALVAKPALLLADEPTGSVDAQQAGEIGVLLRELTQAQGLATILVTHDSTLAGEIADRICRIEVEFPRPGQVRSRLVLP